MVAPINLMEELRLRRWAREHYVPMEMRRTDWHHIVLQEMLLKDQEMNRTIPALHTIRFPLKPDQHYRVDQISKTMQPHVNFDPEMRPLLNTEMYIG